MKKKLSAFLAFTMILSIILTAPMLAVSAADDKISADINLEVGTMSGSVFTPLSSGTVLKANDIITVRICPKTDFLCGSSRYVVMFSSDYLQIVGSGKDAFTPNNDNTFYKTVSSGYSGASAVPAAAWPESLKGQFSTYTAVAVSNLSDSNSSNGGHPGYLPGTWLFRFNLKVKQDIAGSGARIWMDDRWFERPSYTTGAAYFVKCTSESQLSTEGSAVNYDFKIDLTGADITLKAGSISTTSPTSATNTQTTKPATTKPASTSPATTKPVTTKPGSTLTTAKTESTATETNAGTTVTTIPGTAVTTRPGAATSAPQTTVVPKTTAAPVKVQTDEVSSAVDKAGIKDWDGDISSLTPDQKEIVRGYLVESGKDVDISDDGFYYVETTTEPASTQTNGTGSTASTTEPGENGNITPSKTALKTIIIVLVIAAVFGAAVVIVYTKNKKK